ncbi:hypothetical protein R75461_08110 [Paraburkholderia nemoris]|nr:hypothetical protein R75461_08110 [Paraburkholderia nemoris]
MPVPFPMRWEGLRADHYPILQADGFHEHEEAGYR